MYICLLSCLLLEHYNVSNFLKQCYKKTLTIKTCSVIAKSRLNIKICPNTFINILINFKTFFKAIHQCSLKIPERYEKCLRVSSSVMGKFLSTSPRGGGGGERVTSQTANVGRGRMSPGIKILPLPGANGLLR
jgi:hypothetical protein